MMKKLKKYAPPGYNIDFDIRFSLWGLFIAFLYSLTFIYKYLGARSNLFYGDEIKLIVPGAIMPGFLSIMGKSMWGFMILAVVMLEFVFMHYLYFRQGSMSIYLMKRLPDGKFIHRCCWTLPLLGIVLCVVTAAIVLALYYLIYVGCTPDECLSAGYWRF